MQEERYTRRQMLECSISLLEGCEERIQTKTELVETLIDALCEAPYEKLYRYAQVHRCLPRLKEDEEAPVYAPHEILGFIRESHSERLGLPSHLRAQKNLIADIEEYKQAIAAGQE